MPIRSCFFLNDLDMRHIIRTARYVQKYVPGSDCVGILVYAKRSSADFDNDNMTI